MKGKKAAARAAAGMLLLATLPAWAPAAWVDNFDGASLDPRWTVDTTSASTSITFNAAQDRVDFTTNTNTNMWANRTNAPILWTAAPDPNHTLSFEFEAMTTMVSNVDAQIAGVMAWNGSSTTTGVRAAQLHDWPNAATDKATFQVFNVSTPGDSGDLNVNTMWLKLRWDKDGGTGGVDRWTAFYATSDPSNGGWTQNGIYNGDYNFSRLGLFLKGNNATARAANFDYAALSVVVPEPSTLLVWSLLAGLGVGLGWRRRK